LRRFSEIGGGKKKVVYGNNRDEMFAGIMGRMLFAKSPDGVYRRPILPDKDALRRHAGGFIKRIIRVAERVRPLTPFEFLARYKGPKLRAYEDAFESLRTTPLGSEDFLVRAFVKDEKMDPGKVPRIIRPVSTRANARLGLYVYPAEKAIYTALDRYFGERGVGRTVTKGLNAFEIGALAKEKWDRFEDPVAFVLDCSRFDQHVSQTALRKLRDLVVSVLRLSVSEEAELRSILDRQLISRIRASTPEASLKVDIEGQLDSGVMNTSLYGVAMMCMMVDIASRGKRRELLSAGDDTNIIMERKDAVSFRERITAVGRECGFVIRVDKECDELEQLDFCRMRPVFDGTCWRMVRLLSESLNRDHLTVKAFDSKRRFEALRKSIGDCGLSLTYGIPMMQSFYNHLRRGAEDAPVMKDVVRSGMRYLATGLTIRNAEVTVEARVSFFLAFGVTPAQQEVYEQSMDVGTIDYHRHQCDSRFEYNLPHYDF